MTHPTSEQSQPPVVTRKPFTQRAIFPWLVVLAIFIVLLVIFSPVVIVRSGHRGIATFFGDTQGEVYTEGIHLKYPLLRVHQLDVRTQVAAVSTVVTTQDMQLVTVTVATNYHLNDGEVRHIFETVGKRAEEALLIPAVQASVSRVATDFTAAELVSIRSAFTTAIAQELELALVDKALVFEDVEVTEVIFAEALQEAFEARAVSEQELQALRDQNEISREELARIETLGKALRNNEAYIQYEIMRKWDGESPLYLPPVK